MKKIFSFLVSMLFIFTGNAQLKGKYIGNSGVGSDLSIQDNQGKLIPIGAREDAKGNPYLLEGWSNAKVYLKSGTNYSDTAFNYSLLDEKLYFNKNNTLFVVSDDVKEFILSPLNTNVNETKNKNAFHFANGYPLVDGLTEKTFYQVLTKGANYHLLKWQHKKIREVYTYGSSPEFEYADQIVYYIFNTSANKMLSIGNKTNANNIKSTLSIEESNWKAYLKNHNANSKDELSLIEFVTFLNTF